MYTGHVIYDLVHDNGETFSTSERFESADRLFHYSSFTYLNNMQQKYLVEEVRIAEIYIQGLSLEETEEIMKTMYEQDTPLGDFGLSKEKMYG